MAFWKKSEDPWDIDPKKRRQTPSFYIDDEPEAEERMRLADAVKQWGEKLNAAVSEEAQLSPEPCPRCGKEMVQGYVTAARDILWVPGAPSLKKKWIGPNKSDCLRVDDEGVIYTYKTAWHCPDCQWMCISTAGMQSPYDTPEPFAQDGESEEKEEPNALLEKERGPVGY